MKAPKKSPVFNFQADKSSAVLSVSRGLFLLYMHFPKCTIVLFFNKNYFYAILQLFNFYINIFNYYINIINFNIDIYKL